MYEPKNNIDDNENDLADSGARNGLPSEGVGKKVCRKVGQLDRKMADQFQDKTSVLKHIFSCFISLFNKEKSPNPAYTHYL